MIIIFIGQVAVASLGWMDSISNTESNLSLSDDIFLLFNLAAVTHASRVSTEFWGWFLHVPGNLRVGYSCRNFHSEPYDVNPTLVGPDKGLFFCLNEWCAIGLANLCELALQFVCLNERFIYLYLINLGLFSFKDCRPAMLSNLKCYTDPLPQWHNLNPFSIMIS